MTDLDATRRLVEIIRELCFAPSLDSLMPLVDAAARELTHAEGAAFVLKDGDTCVYAHENAIAPLWYGQRLALHDCICGWAISHKQAVIVEDVDQDARIPLGTYTSTFVKSLMVMPLGQADPVGVIGVYWAERHQPLTREVELLQTLADTTTIVIQRIREQTTPVHATYSRIAELERINARLRAEVLQRHTAEAELKRLSLTDGLTGLYNRRGFFLMAGAKLRQAQQRHQSVMVLFIDVDYLKQVNDYFGHEAGDLLILGTATSMHQTFQEEDLLARLGGDEFVVLVADRTQGDPLVERLRANAETFTRENDLPYPLSVSVGLAVGQWHDSEFSLASLIAQADAAMYAQKHRRQPINFAEIKARQGWQ